MVTDELESTARQLWDVSQRVAMQIAGLSRDRRNHAYEMTEEALRETASQLIQPADVDKFVSLQLQLIREVVAKIDLSGKPTGGHA